MEPTSVIWIQIIDGGEEEGSEAGLEGELLSACEIGREYDGN